MEATDPAPVTIARPRKPGEPPGWAKLAIVGVLAVAVAGLFVVDGHDKSTKQVTHAQYGDRWPLTVQSGTLKCLDHKDVVIRVGETWYALNGTAKDDGSFEDIDPIWADDPNLPGLKKNIGVLIDDGLKLC